MRLVVGGRGDVELVALQEFVSPRTQQRRCTVEQVGRRDHVVAVRFLRLHAGIERDVERALAAEGLDRRDVLAAERAVLDEQRAGLPASHEREPRRRVGHARTLQRHHRRGEQLERVARRQRDPARDRQQAAALQMPQIVLQGFHRVEVVLRQRMQAGRGRAERIEQRHVDQVVAFLAGSDEAARLGHMHAHDRWQSRIDAARIDAARIVREPPPHQVDDLRVQLHRIDLPGAVIVGLQHVGPGARTQHQHARLAQQVVRQRGGHLTEMRQALAPAVEAGQRAHAFAVDEDAQLRRRLGRCVEAQPRRVAQGSARTLDHADQAERAEALLHDPRLGNAQGLRQLLVRRHRGRDPRLAATGRAVPP